MKKRVLRTGYCVLGVLATIVIMMACQKAAGTYTCPMHPQIQQSQPGSCPICGMTLVPVKKEKGPEDHSKHQGVYISPERQQLIGVATARAEKKELKKTIRAAGRMAYNPELAQAQTEYLEARKLGNSFLEASKKRLQLLGMDEAWIAELGRNGTVDKNLYLPQGGVRLIEASVYESELPVVKPGLAVKVIVPGNPEMILEGKIKSMASLVDAQTRSVKTFVEVLSGTELKPDTYLTVEIAVPLGEVVAIPKSAVLVSGTRKIALVAHEGSYFEPREIVAAAEGDLDFGVSSGVVEGEMVVTSANFLIDSESQLRAALQQTGGHKH